jgi:hypothetical protein
VRIPICIEYSAVHAGPLLMPSRLTDSEQKIMWGDEHWARLSGSGAVAQVVDSNLYLAMSLRNSGSGVAVPIKPSSVLVALGARIVSSALDAVQ